MRPVRFTIFLLWPISCGLSLVAAQDKPEVPVKVSVCELLADPKAWNHKLVEVTGFASHGFEDSGFSDPECDSRYRGLWMSYGGKRRTGTKSTVNENERSSDHPLVVEGMTVPLVEDAEFTKFDDFLHDPSQPETIVHATVVARFFSGRQEKLPGGGNWAGYGHLGCCSLFVIVQVLHVDEHTRKDVDYSDDPEQPDALSFRFLSPVADQQSMLAIQRKAEAGADAYVFTDPRQVAEKAMKCVAKGYDATQIALTQSKDTPVRKVYQASAPGNNVHWMIVVSRPYWLSTLAEDPNRVAWVVLAAYQIGE